MIELVLSDYFKEFTTKDIVSIKSPNHPLHHLNQKQLASLLNNYYFYGIKNSEILKKYKVVIDQPNHLYYFLPKVFINIWCPYDGTRYQAKLPSKSKFSSSVTELHCPNCGHIAQDSNDENSACSCKHCEKKKLEETKTSEYLELSRNEKIELFLDKERSKAKVVFQSISMSDRLDIAAILQQSNTSFGEPIPRYGNYSNSCTPIHQNTLQQLYYKGILKIHGSPSIELFQPKELDMDFNFRALEFDLNVFDEQSINEMDTFEKLKYEKDFNITDEDEFRKIWRSGVLKVLFNIVDFCIQKERIPISEISIDARNKLHTLFSENLEDYSAAQVYEIIWPAFRRTSKAAIDFLSQGNLDYLEKSRYEAQLFSQLVNEIDIQFEFRKFEKYPLKGFNLNNIVPVPRYLIVLFEDVLNNDSWFYTKLPSIREIESTNLWSKRNFYQSLRSKEAFLLQYEIERNVEEAEYGFITPFGLVMEINKKKHLFATEKDLFFLMEIIETEQDKKFEYNSPDWTAFSKETDWSFKTPFTSATIYNLISQLTKTNKMKEGY